MGNVVVVLMSGKNSQRKRNAKKSTDSEVLKSSEAAGKFMLQMGSTNVIPRSPKPMQILEKLFSSFAKDNQK
jgi:hypothetical protein